LAEVTTLADPDEGAQDKSNGDRDYPQHTVPAMLEAKIGDAHGNDRHPQE
jgi:hypothetical protein